ncbi:type I pullulanase [Streptomyces sulfonofaciens]|uniref:Type I pullulanase n=1 Tax=Streptomyces sulfonofaciens TaxID=68272 RepID=A0A919KTL0_9ACTN|nr:alpha-amylase family glycosyl hydrolase [Streptomyces sulfonofaciens]GHH71952.1 type I pullulanase [Streptomyces sulfonofaciens]
MATHLSARPDTGSRCPGRALRGLGRTALAAAGLLVALLPGTGQAAPPAAGQHGFAATPTAAQHAAAPDTLGAVHTPAHTTFRIWSPDSSDVTVRVGDRSHPLRPVALEGYSDVYQAVVEGDLRGRAYQFSVAGRDVPDPYARMVRPGTTEGIVIDDAALPPHGGWAPAPPLANREDATVYELSVRDFTIDPSSGVDPDKRGRFLGLVQTGTRHNGVPTGIDHLKELGVTDVELMPSFDFGSTEPNWGYDPVGYNTPEEQYSQFTDPEDRIREFKDMVNGFHRNGIRVIMDVVYNHTLGKEVFQGITPRYYTPNDLSGTGNSLDDGNPMVSRMIRDSLEHWVRDYHVDGFRFDLMGIHYHENVSQWAGHLNAAYPGRTLQFHGEPWSGGVADPLEPRKVRYGTVPTLAGAHVGVFNGAYRDAIKGGTRDASMAYMGGSGDASAIATGMRGSPLAAKSTDPLPDPWDPAFAYDPEQTVNYVSVHDDLNLWDKITYSGGTGGADGRAGRIDRFAAGMVLTSQGIPFLSEGDEFLRSKVVGGDYTTAMNSYNASDSVNALHWGDKTANAGVFSYYRDALALRRSTPALRLTSWDAVHDQMATQTDGPVVVSRISSRADAPDSYDTVVVDNPADTDYSVALPPGTWTKVLDASGAVHASDRTCGGLSVTVFTRN